MNDLIEAFGLLLALALAVERIMRDRRVSKNIDREASSRTDDPTEQAQIVDKLRGRAGLQPRRKNGSNQ
jgi:hypothetical protein